MKTNRTKANAPKGTVRRRKAAKNRSGAGMSVQEATRAAVIAAREATESLRQQSPMTLEEAKAQGKLTSFHPDEMDL